MLDSKEISPLELLGKQKPALGKYGLPLRNETAEALHSMTQAARKENLNILCISGYRSYDNQKDIWNQKFQKLTQKGMSAENAILDIIQYSTIPGTSRHHWGTDVDIILETKEKTPDDPMLEEYFAPGGLYADLDQWLKENAATYGFCLVYTHDPKRTGFAFEPWHWSYSALSVEYLRKYLSLDLNEILKDKSVEGSDRFDPAFIKKYLENWVLGINPQLIPKT